MDNILECANMYKTLLEKEYVFTLENDIKFSIYFSTSNFYHLLGLEKLIDVIQFNGKKPNQIYKQILNGKISNAIVERSKYYHKIRTRIENFEKILDLLKFKKSNKIIIEFNPQLLSFETKLEFTKYILYQRDNDSVSHLTIGKKGKLYPETFFVEEGNAYLTGQNLYDIVSIDVIDKHKNMKRKVL